MEKMNGRTNERDRRLIPSDFVGRQTEDDECD